MPYFTYYLLWLALSWLLREPIWLLGILAFLLLRRVLPDPGRLFGSLSRLGPLRAQIEANPANSTARLELARHYLDLRRPGRALEQLEEARRRFPDDAELLFTSGQALLELKRYDEAITALDAALHSSARVRFGLPYLVKGDAHYGAGRWLEAAQSYEEYLGTNSSDVEGYVRLGRAALKLGRRDDARRVLEEGGTTYEALRGGVRRKAFGPWVRLQWLRATRFGAPRAAFAFMLVGLALVAAGYGGLLWWRHDVAEREREAQWEREYEAARVSNEKMLRAYQHCGSVDVSEFAGVYLERDARPGSTGSDAIRVVRDRIQERMFGPDGPLAEWCFTRVLERSPGRLRAEAVVHEDIQDPGDAWLTQLVLERTSEGLLMSIRSERGDFAPRQLVRQLPQGAAEPR
ncbi:MAG TPA: tetratricopeptide repeat protein [Polyangiaceae bacterium]|nr:tetratricopeptide repeat protein [Polyangiaceae bacterium]